MNRRIEHCLPPPVGLWSFKTSTFNRKDWDALLFGECPKQVALPVYGSG